MTIKSPRHPECRDCIFFHPERVAGRCVPCGAGEFFEERMRDRRPIDHELANLKFRKSEFFDDND